MLTVTKKAQCPVETDLTLYLCCFGFTVTESWPWRRKRNVPLKQISLCIFVVLVLQLRNLDREISEIRETNLHLEEKVETLSLQNSSSVFNHSANSLFSELSMSQHMSQSTDSVDMAGISHNSSIHQPVSTPGFMKKKISKKLTLCLFTETFHYLINRTIRSQTRDKNSDPEVLISMVHFSDWTGTKGKSDWKLSALDSKHYKRLPPNLCRSLEDF